jgi:hypothetical protein
MKNININVKENKDTESGKTAAILRLFEKSDTIFCPTYSIKIKLLEDESVYLSVKMIGILMSRLGFVSNVIKYDGVLTRGWMVKYTGTAGTEI